ncbi:unnamed protein product [Polarella glacialis]|uniref:Uncharacterized protein n=1 Tax=Polarella glacialis TaxID=89957 RepID=A0A813FF48_POLGL|nr:unnamed protein product [Polarella glacialis]
MRRAAEADNTGKRGNKLSPRATAKSRGRQILSTPSSATAAADRLHEMTRPGGSANRKDIVELVCELGQKSALTDFKPRSLANLIWACATLKADDKTSLSAVAHHSALCTFGLRPQEIAMAARWFAKTHYAGAAAAGAVASATALRADSPKPKETANVSWGCTRSNTRSDFPNDAIPSAASQTTSEPHA